jgi:PAS domain-containing protein
MKSLRYVDANRAALRFTGYTLGELQQRRVHDLHPDRAVKPLLDACVPADHCRAKLSPYHAGIFPFRKKDGTIEELDVYCHFVKHGDDESLLYLEGRPRRTAEQ